MKYVVIAGTALIVIYALYKTYQRASLDKDLDQLIAGGAVILDVRTVSEFEDAHLKDAINIPLSKLRTQYTQLDPSKVYITCCSHGLRSVKARDLLKERGFKKIYNGGPWAGLEASPQNKQRP